MLKSQALKQINDKYAPRGKHPNTRKNLGAVAKWKTLPTIAIRIPEIFKNKLLDYAQSWDEVGSIQGDRTDEIKEKLRTVLSMPVRSSKGTEALKLAIQAILDTL